MITANQLRAARAMLGLDQRGLAQRAGLSVPTIQRMEASDGVVRGNVDSLMKLVSALSDAGIELIRDGEVSTQGGHGVRFASTTARMPTQDQNRPDNGDREHRALTVASVGPVR